MDKAIEGIDRKWEGERVGIWRSGVGILLVAEARTCRMDKWMRREMQRRHLRRK
jgi:hypothetical protein